jgi:signal transduction histidine kinase
MGKKLKYGEGRLIWISLKKAGTKALVVVEDHGIGIAVKDQARIFDRFESAVSANTVSGMGLGLFISRKNVEAHQGKISVQSEIGQGSVFTVELPL